MAIDWKLQTGSEHSAEHRLRDHKFFHSCVMKGRIGISLHISDCLENSVSNCVTPKINRLHVIELPACA
ncbi:unnamed protein product [Dicrocoelium dendriticum]|nr:unnamed protein product [Dicrocoelium dendriticum]